MNSGIIRVAHPDVERNVKSVLAAPVAAGAASCVVLDNNGFADNDYFTVGVHGDNQTEEGSVDGAVTRGQTLSIDTTLAFAHEHDAPVQKINERAIKIYGAATDGGSGTLIASIDAITTPIADAVMIQWDKPFTEFVLASSDTAYDFYYAVFTDGTTDSSASTYVPASGLTYTKIEPLIRSAKDLADIKDKDKRVSRRQFVDWMNDFQDAVLQYVYQDPRTGEVSQKDWSFEVTRDVANIVTVEGQDVYSLTSLSSALKYPNSDKAILTVQVGEDLPLEKQAAKDFDRGRYNVAKATVSGSVSIGGTTITVDDTSDFNATGSLRIGGQTVTYTSKTSTTFTVPASGDGSVTEAISDGEFAWQNMQFGRPTRYHIDENSIVFDVPPDADRSGKKVKIRFLKALSRVASVSDGIEIPFTNVAKTYLVARIFYKKGMASEGDAWMKKFENEMFNNAQSDVIPQGDEWKYWELDRTLEEEVFNYWE